MRYIQFTFIIIVFIFSCQEKKSNSELEKHKNKVIITGEFINVISTDSLYNVGIYVNDYISKDLFSKEKKVDSTNTFRFEFKVSKRQDIMILYNTIIKLIVEPGDSIHLTFDAQSKSRKDILSRLKISGDNNIINNNLNYFFTNNPINYDEFRNNKQELSPNNFKKYRDSVFKAQAKFINELIATNTFSKPLKNWLEAEKLFALPTSYSFYDYYKSDGKAQIELEKHTDLSSINIDKYDINNLPKIESKYLINANVSNRLPKNILDYYLITSKDEISKLEPKEAYTFLLKKILYENSEKAFLSQLIYNEIVQSNLNKISIDSYENNKELVDSILNNTLFKKSIQEKYVEIKKRIENQKLTEKVKLLEFKSDNISELLKEMVNNANGKPIYIDNWATWCSPCLSEFKESTPKLIAQFKDSIEFVFLCYKSNKKQWETIITDYNLEGKHYFIEDNQYEDLSKLLSLDGFPTYTLINKKGEIINFSFRPSNPETYKKLNQLIAE